MRVGDVVTVSGQFIATTNLGPGQAAVYITLPSASNFTNECQLAGTGTSDCTNFGANPRMYARIYADTTNDRAICEFYNPFNTATSFKMSYHFTYVIV
jgi:hypothetical protein